MFELRAAADRHERAMPYFKPPDPAKYAPVTAVTAIGSMLRYLLFIEAAHSAVSQEEREQ
jgi:hypothetical protein